MGMSTETSYIQLFSDFLSLITIGFCFVTKIPQITNIVKLKSAAGISLTGLMLELSSYTIMFSYNYANGYALLSYMEYPIILLQEIVLIFCVMAFKNCLKSYMTLFGAILYIITFMALYCRMVPLGLLIFLVPLCTPVGASSKVVQLMEIIRSKDSASVSILTWFLSAFTNLTRLFTIAVDSADVTLLLNFSVNVLLSSAVMVAAYIYKRPKQD